MKNNENIDEKVEIVSHAHKTRAHRFVKKNKTCRLCLSKKGAKYTCYLTYTARLLHPTQIKRNSFCWIHEFKCILLQIWHIFHKHLNELLGSLTFFRSKIPFLDDNNSDTNLRVSKLNDFSVRFPSTNASDSGLSIIT